MEQRELGGISKWKQVILSVFPLFSSLSYPLSFLLSPSLFSLLFSSSFFSPFLSSSIITFYFVLTLLLLDFLMAGKFPPSDSERNSNPLEMDEGNVEYYTNIIIIINIYIFVDQTGDISDTDISEVN